MKAAVGAGCAAMATLAVVAARQLDVISRLPDPPGRVWASEAIVNSSAAHPAGLPDGVLGMASYGVTLGLLALSAPHPRLRSIVRAKLLLDGAAAGVNTVRQLVRFRRMCSWCMGTVALTAWMVAAGWRATCEER